MKFKLGPDFYKALALFSQAGCPFTQSGSQPSQIQATRPLTASSAVSHSAEMSGSREGPPSVPSTADSDQRILVPSVGASMHSSSRPSTSSTSTWKSEAQSSAYFKMSNGHVASMTNYEKPQFSPFFSGPKTLPSTSEDTFGKYEKRVPGPMEASEAISFISSDPVWAVAPETLSRTNRTLQPACPVAAHRPSTAPTFNSQRLSQMLPPRRELPFKVPRTATSDTGQQVARTGKSPFRTLPTSSDTTVVAGIAPSTGDSKTCIDQGALERPKNTPAKRATTANRGTRSATPSSRSHKKPSVIEDDSPVASVEELLRGSRPLSEKKDVINQAVNDADRASVSQIALAATEPKVRTDHEGLKENLAGSAGRDKQAEEYQTPYQRSSIDTQSLLARVDERQRQKQNKRKDSQELHEEQTPLPPSKRIASDVPLDSVCLLPSNEGARVPLSRSHQAETASISKDQSSTHDISRFREATHLDVARGSNFNENSGVLPLAEDPATAASAASVSRSQSSSQRRVLADNSNVAHAARQLTSANISTMALMNDPNFVRSPEVAQWSDLPPEQRGAVLETWMCEQLESESFAQLLKTLDGTWQRLFFGR